MNYADIKTIDIQDGTGIRVSIYVSGCHFHCKGCHNQEAWDFNYGKKFDDSTIDYIIDLMNHDYIAGLSILGGEPLENINQQGLLPLVKRVKEIYPDKTIWCYTGYDFEKDIFGKMYKEFNYTREFLKNIDIIVDGQFIEEKKMVDLKFRGSINQKKIDIQSTLKTGSVVQLKFGDEERYQSAKEDDNNKIVLFKEYKIKENKGLEFEENNVVPNVVNDDNVISIKPAYEIKKVEEIIAAKGINDENDNNL